MNFVVWIAAVTLAVTFLVAAVGKVRDQPGTVEGAIGLGVASRYGLLVARILPATEAASAVLVLVPTLRCVGAGLCVALLACFSFAIAKTLRAGRTPVCHCFGARSRRPIDRSLLTRNAALTALALVVMVGA